MRWPLSPCLWITGDSPSRRSSVRQLWHCALFLVMVVLCFTAGGVTVLVEHYS